MKETRAEYLPISKLHPFEGHPFHVKDDAEMEQLVYSILTQGLLTPITVRPLENNEYEVISGHRRLHAARMLNLETVPVTVCEVSREEAMIMLVDSNLHREHILPSEKAMAYKLKLDAMKAQGKRTDLTCGQVGHKSRDDVSETESGRQVQRYIRLTYLIPELLEMMDEEKIAFSVTPQEAQELFSAKEIFFRWNPWYLLKGHIKIDAVLLEQLSAQIVRHEGGRFNFDGLFGLSSSVKDTTAQEKKEVSFPDLYSPSEEVPELSTKARRC